MRIAGDRDTVTDLPAPLLRHRLSNQRGNMVALERFPYFRRQIEIGIDDPHVRLGLDGDRDQLVFRILEIAAEPDGV